jgi:hypothetical protein
VLEGVCGGPSGSSGTMAFSSRGCPGFSVPSCPSNGCISDVQSDQSGTLADFGEFFGEEGVRGVGDAEQGFASLGQPATRWKIPSAQNRIAGSVIRRSHRSPAGRMGWGSRLSMATGRGIAGLEEALHGSLSGHDGYKASR